MSDPLQSLLNRGISPETLAAFGVKLARMFGNTYAKYPIYLNGEPAGHKYKLITGTGDKYWWTLERDGASRALYGGFTVKAGKQVALCEGEPDVWLMHSLGLPAVSMLCGAKSISYDAIDDLRERDPRYVFICYDNDEPGRQGARAIGRALRDAGLQCDALDLGSLGLPAGGDICDLYQWVGQDRERFKDAFSRAKSLAIPVETHTPRPYSGADSGKFAEFRRQHDIVAIAESLTHMHKRGSRYVGRCPLGTHADSSPSFTVWPEQGKWYCFGCAEKGDTYDLAQLARRRPAP